MNKVIKLLVIIGVCIMFIIGCGSEKKIDENKVQQQKEPVKQEQTTTTPESTEKNSDNKSTQKQVNSEAIPGIEAADVKLNLKKYGFQFTGPRPLKDDTGYLDDGKAKDIDTGAELSCTITAISPTVIKYLTFRVDGTMVAGMLQPELFTALARGYLGFVATLPYDGAEPERAREWVEKNIDQANQPGKSISTTIGPVEYTLAGGKYRRILSMKPKITE